MPHKKPLDPLIPLDDLKKVVAGLIAVPKDRIAKPKGKTKRKKRS